MQLKNYEKVESTKIDFKEKVEYKKNNPETNIDYTCYHYYYIISTGETGRYIDYTDMI